MIVHEPVLLQEVLGLLVPPAEDGLLLDATLGQGGHAEAFLSKYPHLLLVGVDADASVLETARERLQPFAARTRLVNEWFGSFLAAYGPEAAETRALLRQTVGGMVGNVWRDGATREAVFE